MERRQSNFHVTMLKTTPPKQGGEAQEEHRAESEVEHSFDGTVESACEFIYCFGSSFLEGAFSKNCRTYCQKNASLNDRVLKSGYRELNVEEVPVVLTAHRRNALSFSVMTKLKECRRHFRSTGNSPSSVLTSRFSRVSDL